MDRIENRAFTTNVSDEPLEVILGNECQFHPESLATKRFRRLWNEIVALQKDADADRRDWKLIADELSCEPTREKIVEAIRNLYKQNHTWAEIAAKWKEMHEALLREV